jgi:hypothetical protein
VEYKCDQDTHGAMNRKYKGEFSHKTAERCKTAFTNKSYICDPHPGPFSEFVVTHAPQNPMLVGKYTLTSRIVNGRPVYIKEKITSPRVTNAWCSRDGTWIIGDLAQMNANTKQGFAVAVHSTAWPHYTHDYTIEGDRYKIFSHSVKADAPVPEMLFSSDDEGGENGEGGAGGEGDSDAEEGFSETGGSAGSEAARGKRLRVPTDRAGPDAATQASMKRAREQGAKRRKKKTATPGRSGGGAGGAAGGAGGAGGAAGGTSSQPQGIPSVR